MQLSEETGRAILRDLGIIKSLLRIQKERWVKVTTIREMTGWNGEKMRQARKNGLVVWKKDKKTGMWYNPDSIPPLFIKEPTKLLNNIQDGKL